MTDHSHYEPEWQRMRSRPLRALLVALSGMAVGWAIAASAFGADLPRATQDNTLTLLPGQIVGDEPHGTMLVGELPGCINGHPLPRSPHITYGGLPTCHGYERDHIVPLCLRGLDILDNLQYQPIGEARLKDVRERQMCDAYCRGDITLNEAQMQFQREWPSMTPRDCQ